MTLVLKMRIGYWFLVKVPCGMCKSNKLQLVFVSGTCFFFLCLCIDLRKNKLLLLVIVWSFPPKTRNKRETKSGT